MRCAIYTRVSTDNQVEKDYNSLETQKESLMTYIQAHKYEGWELYDIYEDAGKGKKRSLEWWIGAFRL